MQALIESLNRLGAQALEFAWPMLWQSSLLIALVFLLEWGLRRRVRPSVRYAVWWLVLLKLVLPPSLALPTGAGWWLRSGRTAAAPAPTLVISYGPQVTERAPEPATFVPVSPPAPRLSLAAWAMLGAGTVSLGMLAWMLVRWGQTAKIVRRSLEPEAWVEAILEENRRALNLRPLRLRLLQEAMSPVVCGLFRPVILVPAVLLERLSRAQLRGVLVHELVHLRRGDVWANCFQALLQAVYWWQPLLWVANARIRRVREEAVDDAVVLALSDKAETYAPTLLEVAKLALQRPTATLGLVGILESRSFLRQRIERLLEGRIPRRTGLTLASALCVLALGAFALPMGQAPDKEKDSGTSTTASATNAPLLNRIYQVDPGTFLMDLKKQFGEPKMSTATPGLTESTLTDLTRRTNGAASNGMMPSAQVLRKFCQSLGLDFSPPKSIFLNDDAGVLFVRASAQEHTVLEKELQRLARGGQSKPAAAKSSDSAALTRDGKLLYEMGKLDEAEAKLKAATKADPSNQAAYYYLNLIAEARWKTRTNANSAIRVIPAPGGQRGVLDKLNRLRVGPLEIQDLSLAEVAQRLTERSRERDPDGKGVNFTIVTNAPQSTGSVDPNTGLPIPAQDAASTALAAVRISVGPSLADAPLIDVVDVIVRSSPVPLKWSVLDDGVAFSAKVAGEAPPLYTRMIKVDPRTFDAGLRSVLGLTGEPDPKTLQQSVRDFFATVGVNLAPPKTVFFNDRQGTLLVRATLQDLDTIETAVQVLNTAPPQVVLKATFLDLPEELLPEFWKSVSTSSPGASNIVSILTPREVQSVRGFIGSHGKAALLNEASVVTLSGRQTRIEQVDLQTIVTNINPLALKPPGVPATGQGSTIYLSSTLPFGPTLDVVPYVGADGYTLRLNPVATITEFLGYDQPTNSPAVYVDGKKQKAVLPLPHFRVRSVSNSIVLWDGQTVLFGGFTSENITKLKQKVPVLGDVPVVGPLFRSESSTSEKKRLFVLLTATLIDPAGNRLHTDQEVDKTVGLSKPH